MSLSVFPLPTAATSPTTFGQVTVVPAAGALYKFAATFGSGVYTITCVSSTITTMSFMNGTTNILDAATSNGTVTVTLATAPTHVILSTNTGTNIEVTFTQTKVLLPTGAPSGVLYTITSTQMFTGRGKAWVCLVGGGNGGNGGIPAQTEGGNGGASGKVLSGTVTFTEDTLVTIGAGGVGGTSGTQNNYYSPNAGAAGGATTLGSLLTSANGGAGAGGYGTYQSGNTRLGREGAASPAYNYPWITNLGGPGNTALTGGGGASSYNYAVGAYGGSGYAGLIGTGGRGGWDGVPAESGTGYGSGGGGGSTNSWAYNNTNQTFTYLNGGIGAPGIAYIVLV